MFRCSVSESAETKKQATIVHSQGPGWRKRGVLCASPVRRRRSAIIQGGDACCANRIGADHEPARALLASFGRSSFSTASAWTGRCNDAPPQEAGRLHQTHRAIVISDLERSARQCSRSARACLDVRRIGRDVHHIPMPPTGASRGIGIIGVIAKLLVPWERSTTTGPAIDCLHRSRSPGRPVRTRACHPRRQMRCQSKILG